MQKGGANMAYTRQYDDLRLMAKRANQRMVELEKRDIVSPAYQAVQAKLEMMGRRSGNGRGRRFSETGKATYNEYEATKKVLEEFLGATTSTLTGSRTVRDKIYNTADKRYNLSKSGIGKNEYFQFIGKWADKNKDKILSSEQAIEIYRAYSLKKGEIEPEDILSDQDIAEIIKKSKNVKEAYKEVGITYQDIQAARNLYEKDEEDD